MPWARSHRLEDTQARRVEYTLEMEREPQMPQEAEAQGKRPLRLMLEIAEGRAAGALFENGFLRHCLDQGAEVIVLSPGASYPPFVARYQLPGVHFRYLSIDTPRMVKYARMTSYEARLGGKLILHGFHRARKTLWRLLGERLAAADAVEWRSTLLDVRPACFLTTDMRLGYGRGLVALCGRNGIATVGNVFSWDHPFYEQKGRPDLITCWSPSAKERIVATQGVTSGQVEVIGSPAFDAYFDPQGVWSREQFCQHMGLEPQRPILLFATLGQMRQHFDETGPFRALMEAVDDGRVPGRPQVVLRLHPLSYDYYFGDFRSHPDVRFSRYERYCPGMRWWPLKDEMILAGNLLRHADVCITPGSTMAVEAAIFDTPSIVPAFNQFTNEDFARFFRSYWLQKHFRLLTEKNLVAVPRGADEMVNAINRALADRSWLREGRQVIRETVLGPLDGRATERLARIAVEQAARGAGHTAC